MTIGPGWSKDMDQTRYKIWNSRLYWILSDGPKLRTETVNDISEPVKWLEETWNQTLYHLFFSVVWFLPIIVIHWFGIFFFDYFDWISLHFWKWKGFWLILLFFRSIWPSSINGFTNRKIHVESFCLLTTKFYPSSRLVCEMFSFVCLRVIRVLLSGS